MKKFIAVILSVLMFITTFSGCGFKLSNLIKITPITTAIESAVTAQPDVTEEPNETQAPSQKITTSLPQTEGSVPNTVNATTKAAQTTKPMQTTTKPVQTTAKAGIQPNGIYTTQDDVSLYIHTYGKLPKNFITKEQAKALGWPGGDLEPYAPGKCIGGNHFGNYPNDNGVKPFPEASGRKFFECDIDTLGKHDRGPKRLVYSNDGLVYYTPDHYKNFTKLY